MGDEITKAFMADRARQHAYDRYPWRKDFDNAVDLHPADKLPTDEVTLQMAIERLTSGELAMDEALYVLYGGVCPDQQLCKWFMWLILTEPVPSKRIIAHNFRLLKWAEGNPLYAHWLQQLGPYITRLPWLLLFFDVDNPEFKKWNLSVVSWCRTHLATDAPQGAGPLPPPSFCLFRIDEVTGGAPPLPNKMLKPNPRLGPVTQRSAAFASTRRKKRPLADDDDDDAEGGEFYLAVGDRFGQQVADATPIEDAHTALERRVALLERNNKRQQKPAPKPKPKPKAKRNRVRGAGGQDDEEDNNRDSVDF